MIKATPQLLISATKLYQRPREMYMSDKLKQIEGNFTFKTIEHMFYC